METLIGQIQNIATPFSLAAFITAAIIIAIRAQINRDRKLIETASESDRARLVERVLGKVETESMTAGQKYRLALEDLRARSRRFLISAIVVVLLALVAAAISIVALANSKSSLKLDPKLKVSLTSARLIWPKSGISDPSQYPAAGLPMISDDQISAIKDVVEDKMLANGLNPFFQSGSTGHSEICDLTLLVWDDGDGFPDKSSIRVGGDMDKNHIAEVMAVIAAVKFPAPAKIPYTPKSPGVITRQDLQNAPMHMSCFEIKIQLQVTLPSN